MDDIENGSHKRSVRGFPRRQRLQQPPRSREDEREDDPVLLGEVERLFDGGDGATLITEFAASEGGQQVDFDANHDVFLAAAPECTKGGGILAAADVFTVSTTFVILESLRLDSGAGLRIHP
ncbi:hypothetical protein SK571_23760 [Lentzea sp. BCCO 10_0798]|uniref:Uncharacterized protein n=1 Tax=Lentzea kristufekii TaxID=3095430 RepID=A0ABU4TVS4_9PSEU|nr:hypothetical protein [Lentzea sp. BCCO 10_0798]MDX8052413.1 hypothetical protein [Lentzea sp. BCCO 10_0798]